MTVSAYPLSWPESIPRSKAREAGKFKTTLAIALSNVSNSLRLFGSDSGKSVSGIVLSSNVTLGAQVPTDPAVAVWFTWDGLQVCIPVDRYTKPEANLQAIHHIIEARRVELRHGTLALVRASFQGFKALPPPTGTKSWRHMLGLPVDRAVTRADIDAAYRIAARGAHPDNGGSHDTMASLNAARDEALKEIAP